MRTGLVLETKDRNDKTHSVVIAPKPNSSDYFYTLDDHTPYPLKEGDVQPKVEQLVRLVTVRFVGEWRDGKVNAKATAPKWFRVLIGEADEPEPKKKRARRAEPKPETEVKKPKQRRQRQ